MNISELEIAKAKAFFADPLIHKILDSLETAAISTGVYAPLTDDGARQAAMAEVRAIRALRSKLKHFSAEHINSEE